MKCDECNNANICLDHIELPSLGGCTSGIPDRKIATNADRIRSMSDEKLAENLCLTLDCKKCPTSKTCNMGSMCYLKLLDWLQSPVDDEVSDLEDTEVRR